jgi:hypothetical protein
MTNRLQIYFVKKYFDIKYLFIQAFGIKFNNDNKPYLADFGEKNYK